MTERICAVDSCENRANVPGSAKGLCGKHYHRLQRHGDPLVTVARTRPVCSISECPESAVARTWCSKHWTRWDRHGDPEYRFPWEVRDGHKVCSDCGLDLPVSVFGRRVQRSGGFSSACRTCERLRTSGRRAEHPEYVQPVRDLEKNRAAAKRWRQTHPAQVRAQAGLYRARKSTNEAERFDPHEIFVRDGWTCGICLSGITASLRYPDPMSASLDHVVPLSRGGTHTRDNGQASHLICNMRKHART